MASEAKTASPPYRQPARRPRGAPPSQSATAAEAAYIIPSPVLANRGDSEGVWPAITASTSEPAVLMHPYTHLN